MFKQGVSAYEPHDSFHESTVIQDPRLSSEIIEALRVAGWEGPVSITRIVTVAESVK